jgi:hypothetical protein
MIFSATDMRREHILQHSATPDIRSEIKCPAPAPTPQRLIAVLRTSPFQELQEKMWKPSGLASDLSIQWWVPFLKEKERCCRRPAIVMARAWAGAREAPRIKPSLRFWG